MLEAPANGRLECTGPDTDRTCEVRCLGLWREFLLSLRYPVEDRRYFQFFSSRIKGREGNIFLLKMWEIFLSTLY